MRIIISAIIILLSLTSPSFAQDLKFDIDSEWEMDRRYDWIINIKVKDTNYLDYKDSKLKPLTKLFISYRLNPRFNIGVKYTDYEELLCQYSKAIGCRRLHTLDLPTTYQGAIRIIPSPSASKNSGAISNTIARLLLDIGIQKCVLSAVFVPADIFDKVIEDLNKFRFSANSGGGGQLTLQLYSNPIDQSRVLTYQ